jgi:hypothetical protein
MNHQENDMTTISSQTTDGTGAAIIGGEGNTHGPGPALMDAKTLIGNDVVNQLDESLGNIEAIMLDVPRGRVAYAVLAFGGFLGIGEKLFAVPWRALVLDANRKCFVLNVTKDRLETAPGFNKDHWPSMADEKWSTEVHDFYGTPLYWRD